MEHNMFQLLQESVWRIKGMKDGKHPEMYGQYADQHQGPARGHDSLKLRGPHFGNFSIH